MHGFRQHAVHSLIVRTYYLPTILLCTQSSQHHWYFLSTTWGSECWHFSVALVLPTDALVLLALRRTRAASGNIINWVSYHWGCQEEEENLSLFHVGKGYSIGVGCTLFCAEWVPKYTEISTIETGKSRTWWLPHLPLQNAVTFPLDITKTRLQIQGQREELLKDSGVKAEKNRRHAYRGMLRTLSGISM